MNIPEEVESILGVSPTPMQVFRLMQLFSVGDEYVFLDQLAESPDVKLKISYEIGSMGDCDHWELSVESPKGGFKSGHPSLIELAAQCKIWWYAGAEDE